MPTWLSADPKGLLLVFNAMKTLVTGGAGFIGSHLSDALLDRGDEVVIVDDLSSGSLDNISSALAAGAELVEGSILDRELMERTIQRVKPGTVFHFAAQGNVRHSTDHPVKDAELNVVGTLNMIEASRTIGLDRFVFASSGGAIYGEADELPAKESGPTEPLSHYGLSKLAAERYLLLYRRMYMFNSISLRLSNVYGPRQNPKGESGVISIFGELVRDGKPPVIFGDGGQTRDYVYVDDVVTAILAAAATDVEGAVNLGSGVETSLLDLLGAIVEATPAASAPLAGDAAPEFLPERRDEVKRNVLDTSRAGELLGWGATTPLSTGLTRTLESL